MRILYTGDNEGPAIMTLDELCTNFKSSGTFNDKRHIINEEDIRDELTSRGWYEGLHVNGRFLAINLDQFNLEHHDPAMDE